MNTETSAYSGRVPMGRRRFALGLVSAVLSGLLGFAVYASTTWSLEAGPDRLVYFVLPDWALIFCAHLISGVTAVAGLALLVPPFIKLLSRTWLRRLISVLVGLAAAAATLPWLMYSVGIGLNAASATYTKVTAESGESVIVQHSGFDRRDYAVFRRESFFLYERSDGWRTASSDVFDRMAARWLLGFQISYSLAEQTPFRFGLLADKGLMKDFAA